MKIEFSKYHGTGNDFIMVDCTNSPDFNLSNEEISQLCDRRFGIGADGLILIFKHPTLDFSMRYHNADGSQSFCGNGARCSVKFAHSLGLFTEKARFEAIDGVHEATIEGDLISLRMSPVNEIKKDEKAYVVDTGSPHYIEFLEDISQKNIVEFGREIRYSDTYKKEGINVNIVQRLSDNHVKMQTYERGVEDETYSCGTGATAVALSYAKIDKLKDFKIEVKGGKLFVAGKQTENGFDDIFLIGPAEFVFKGEITI